MPPRPRILTWQVHANYCFYLSQVPVDWWLVTRPGHPPGYAGRTASFPWGDNVHEVAPEEVAGLALDAVLYQSCRHWEEDRWKWLSPRQRELPALYLEHDPPQAHPTDTRHWAEEADLLVHVTDFNALMWDSGSLPVRVIDHTAALPPGIQYRGDIPAGIVVVNHIERRGRRLGSDIYRHLQRQVPLALAGMGSETLPDGLGEIPNRELPGVAAHYRFLFSPIRWTSLALAVVEAMSIGMPVVALATTEMSSVIRNGENGWIDNRPERLADVMRGLIDDPALARRWGEGARQTARERFGMPRFVEDWLGAIQQALDSPRQSRRSA